MSARRSPWSSPTAATWRRTRPRWSTVDYERCRRRRDCRDAREAGAPPPHADLAAQSRSPHSSMAYGDVDAAFAGRRTCCEEGSGMHRGCGHSIEMPRRGRATRRAASDRLTCGRRRRRRISAAASSPTCSDATRDDPRDRARRRRRLRAQGVFYPEEAVIAGGRAHARAPGQMDRGPARAFHLRDAGARPVLGRRDRGRRATERSSACAASIAARHRRLSCRGASSCPISPAATVPGPYVVPAYRARRHGRANQQVPTTPVRGAGRPQAVFAMERLMDRAARELELDRAEMRRRNLIRPDADALSGRAHVPRRQAAGLSTAAITRPARRTALATPATTDFARGRPARARAAAISASASRNYVEGTGLGPFEGVDGARARQRQGGRCHRCHQPGPGPRARCCRRSSPTGSAAASRTSW